MNKKRVIALLLAASLAVVPTISVLAEETDQTEEENDLWTRASVPLWAFWCLRFY